MNLLSKLAGLQQQKEILDTLTSREALKCIVNSIYLKSELKKYLEPTIESLQNLLCNDTSQETQFLTCRILFLLTVNRIDLVKQVMKLDIAKGIEKVLLENVSILKDKNSQPIDQNTLINPATVSSEALKLLFNLMLVVSRHQEDSLQTSTYFKNCLIPIFYILFEVPYAESQPMVPPHSQAIHALMQYPYETILSVWRSQIEWLDSLYKNLEEETDVVANTFMDMLDKSVHALIPSGNPDEDGHMDHQQIDATLSPLLLVIRTLAEGSLPLRERWAVRMLPSEEDRLQPVNQGHSLSAYLIKLMTSTMLPQTQAAVCETYFILCDEDANNFTKQVGYGNAIGYLVNKGIPVELPNDEQQQADENINPITGQYISAEDAGPSLADMTDEEKEREAEKLFVLFERLKKTGVVDVENPITKAKREGKFEHIQDNDHDSDSD
ncbi:hypothetical protein G6F36_006028 [Rhizopus arrhizus]|nr:hypothetical protein G6F36_006028 [Rhizopus arrhizus]KAG1422114.1 hypothetical protein G6F59_006374 [Rhizopus arrhizus]